MLLQAQSCFYYGIRRIDKKNIIPLLPFIQFALQFFFNID